MGRLFKHGKTLNTESLFKHVSKVEMLRNHARKHERKQKYNSSGRDVMNSTKSRTSKDLMSGHNKQLYIKNLANHREQRTTSCDRR